MVSLRAQCDVYTSFPSNIGFSNVAEAAHKCVHHDINIYKLSAMQPSWFSYSLPHTPTQTHDPEVLAESNIYHHRANAFASGCLRVCVFVYVCDSAFVCVCVCVCFSEGASAVSSNSRRRINDESFPTDATETISPTQSLVRPERRQRTHSRIILHGYTLDCIITFSMDIHTLLTYGCLCMQTSCVVHTCVRFTLARIRTNAEAAAASATSKVSAMPGRHATTRTHSRRERELAWQS